MCTSARVLTTVRDRLCTADRFTRGHRRTGISGRGIVLRHLGFGHRYIDRRQVGAGLPAVVADTNRRQVEAGLLVAVADTNRRQVEAGLLVAVADTNHPPVAADINRLPVVAVPNRPPEAAGLPAVVPNRLQPASSLPKAGAAPDRLRTMVANLQAVAEASHPAMAQADGLPAMAQAPDRPAMAVPRDRRHNRSHVPPVLAILTLVSLKVANRPSGRLLNRIRAPVPEALTAASAENPSERRAIAAKQAPGAAIAQGENSDETA
jgi:hypothetical protein